MGAVDLEAETWTRPAEVMKMRVEHVIPLSREAKVGARKG
jgi:integrase